MKKTNDKQFLNARAKAGAAARWKNHSVEEWYTIRISRTVKNRLSFIQSSTPAKAINCLITLYYKLHYFDKYYGLDKNTKEIFEEVKNSLNESLNE